MVDVHTIGAGGGSIARISEAGMLRSARKAPAPRRDRSATAAAARA